MLDEVVITADRPFSSQPVKPVKVRELVVGSRYIILRAGHWERLPGSRLPQLVDEHSRVAPYGPTEGLQAGK